MLLWINLQEVIIKIAYFKNSLQIWISYFAAAEDADQDLTDGILRKAELPIVDTIMCQEYLDVNARSDDMHSGFICAGGKGKEESCYVSYHQHNTIK